MTNPTAPTPEPAAGTLATALAIIDSDLFDFRTHLAGVGGVERGVQVASHRRGLQAAGVADPSKRGVSGGVR